MELIVLSLVLILLLALNAFFVLAEFAIVKVRSSRVAEMAANGNARAKTLQGILIHLDEYLSVCQVGITLASVALGMVGKKATDAILGDGEHSMMRYAIAMGVSYIIVSGSHIVLAELVPKSIAIRLSDRAAMASTPLLRFFHIAFFPALWLLNKTANAILRLMGMPPAGGEEHHSEDELRIILDHSQERGMISFRRLLFMENVFDLGELKVKDTMRPRTQVRCLHTQLHWNDNLQTVRAWRFTRYPLIDDDPERPMGLVHLKDVLLNSEGLTPDLKKLARPLLTTTEGTMLEALLAEMQRKRIHAALVTNADGKWSGLVTMEDIIEEIIGTIRDEFEDEEPIHLADTITTDRIHLGVVADGPVAAVRAALGRMPANSLPLPADQIILAIDERERVAGTYLGRNLGMPHARMHGISKPFVMILRSEAGIPYSGTTEKAHVLFVLLTPAGQPRIHQRLQAVIATLLDESEYVQERLRTAETAAEVLDVIRTGEQASLD